MIVQLASRSLSILTRAFADAWRFLKSGYGIQKPFASYASPPAAATAWERPSHDRASSSKNPGPSIEILPEALAKLLAYAEECPGEIGGFGMVKPLDDTLIISEVFITRQRSTSASTEISEDDLAAFLCELLDKGEDPSQLRLYWHSHADMAVFFSSIDVTTMETAFPQAFWVVGLVVNRRGDMKACLYLSQPVPIRLDELPVRLHIEPELRTQVRDEIRTKVRQGYWTATGHDSKRGQPSAYHHGHGTYAGDNQRNPQYASGIPEGNSNHGRCAVSYQASGGARWTI